MMEKPTENQQSNSRPVTVGAGGVTLEGNVNIPENARGIVVLAHGSNAIENSSYYTYPKFAEAFHTSGVATLFVNLLLPEEEEVDQETNFFRLNVSIMEQRMRGIANWLNETSETENLGIGYFGVAVSGAAALVGAAERPDLVHAIVSCAARIDLVEADLSHILAPTLLLIGQNDTSSTVETNQNALQKFTGVNDANKKVEILPGAASLFEPQQVLEQVVKFASQWFTQYLEPI